MGARGEVEDCRQIASVVLALEAAAVACMYTRPAVYQYSQFTSSKIGIHFISIHTLTKKCDNRITTSQLVNKLGSAQTLCNTFVSDF